MTVLLNSTLLNAAIFHHYPELETKDRTYVWEEVLVDSFDEVIISWNATRPSRGDFRIFVALEIEGKEWSPWFLYMQWGTSGQKSFDNKDKQGLIHVYQDTITLLNGMKATAFRIRVDATEEANLSELRGIHVFVNAYIDPAKPLNHYSNSFIDLSIPPISQMCLNHPRKMHLCSPVSTTSVIQYLFKSINPDPLIFADKVLDSSFDIYGNWVLNVVQAAHELGDSWCCWVERLNGFHEIIEKLVEGLPVVVSVRGPLIGSAIPYQFGHLVVVKGYDSDNRRVNCMDPAFPSKEETSTSYALDDFIQAWSRRGNIAYIFKPKSDL